MVMAAAARYERDLYVVLGLGCDCSPEDIRTAYKKLALQCHPDKLLHTGITVEAATAQFQELLRAYEVLSDPNERSKYDHRCSEEEEEALFSAPKTSSTAATAAKSSKPSGPDLTAHDLRAFKSNSAFCGYSDTGEGFYKVYSDLFKKLFAAEVRYAMRTGQRRVPGAPGLGNRNSPEKHVMAFYSYWLRFGEEKESSGYGLKDEKKKEKEKERQKARREYYEAVRDLVEFVMRRDRRVIEMEVVLGKNRFREGLLRRRSLHEWMT